MADTVAHLVAPGSFGGAETVVRALARGRNQLIGPTEVIALTGNAMSERYVETLREMEIEVSTVGLGGRRYMAQAAAVASLAVERQISLVHTHVYKSDFVGYLASRRLRLPVVGTYHGHVGGDWRNRAYEWLDRRLLKRFDRVVCVSRFNRDRLLRIGAEPGRLCVIPNGLEASRVPPREEARAALQLSPHAMVIGWVGRLSHEKGLDLLFESLRHANVPQAEIVVIGDGPLKHEWQTLASGVPNRVSFRGELPNAGALLPAFDVLAIPSRSEGSPMVLLEAMSAGTAVVAFGVGGIPDLISADSGWVVSERDVVAFGAALAEALQNREVARQRATAARQFALEQLGMDRWLERLEGVYDAVLSGNRGS